MTNQKHVKAIRFTKFTVSFWAKKKTLSYSERCLCSFQNPISIQELPFVLFLKISEDTGEAAAILSKCEVTFYFNKRSSM